jgi:molybdate/tungstate transport system substrate-binding protein
MTVLYISPLEPMVNGVIDLMHASHPDITIIPVHVNNTPEILSALTSGRIQADVIIVADYPSLEKKIVPGYADWYIRYGHCDIVLTYANTSPYAGTVTSQNWADILSRDNVTLAVLDPGSDDTRGWRSLISMDLADAYYNRSVFNRVIPPSTSIFRERTDNGTVIDAINSTSTLKTIFFANHTGMSAAVKNGSVDFALDYRGGAYSAGLPILDLPAECDLGNSRYADRYANIMVQTTAGLRRSPPIVFAATIPLVAENQEDAATFIKMMLSPEGEKVLQNHGQFPNIPPEYVYFTKEDRMGGILPGIEYTGFRGVPAT